MSNQFADGGTGLCAGSNARYLGKRLGFSLPMGRCGMCGELVPLIDLSNPYRPVRLAPHPQSNRQEGDRG